MTNGSSENFETRATDIDAGPTPIRYAMAISSDDGDAQALLLAAATGDRAAFAALYDLLAPRVYWLIKRVLPDSKQADEVMREALVEVWRTARGYNANDSSAASWIYAIVYLHAARRARAI